MSSSQSGGNSQNRESKPPGDSQKDKDPVGQSSDKTSSPNPKGKGKKSDSEESVAASAAKMFSATAEIKKILDGLPNKEAQQALTMVAALKNLRVTSMDRPIGQTVVTKKDSPKGESAAAPKKATWKQDAKWVAAEGDRARIVADIKKAGETDLVSLQLALRQQEELMKALKRELNGSVADAKK